jgi:hypothetical protein
MGGICYMSDKSRIKKGNMNDQVGDNNRGWVIGNFTRPKRHPFHEDSFEMQWAELEEGDTKLGGPSLNKKAKTLGVLVRGRLKISFPENGSVMLRNPGDYVFFASGVAHEWEALEDGTVTVTIRWPSIPGDQKRARKHK